LIIYIMAIRIMIFEDNDRLRESITYLLSDTDEYEVAGNYNHCNDAYALVKKHRPDVVIMDIDMPGTSGIEGVKMAKEAYPDTFVIMYTVFENEEKLFQCLCAGANGYFLKKTPPQKLFDAIQEVIDGGAPMSPSIARKVLSSFHVKRNQHYHLTKREEEVLQLLSKGYTAKMIASDLYISFDTARSHLKNIYGKLHVNCGKEAIAKALKEKIV
jgi:DNA-binding NarL/FixJ family response regulator